MPTNSTDTTAILDMAYPVVEKGIKANINAYKRYMTRFINMRHEQLYSPMPSQQIYFRPQDAEELYKAIQVNPEDIKNAIRHTYYYEIANFNPRYAKDECTITLLNLVRYFKLKSDSNMLDLALINMAFSGKFYPSIWYGSFPVSAPNEHVMEYIIGHVLSNKYDIVREGTVIGAVKSVAKTWVNSYATKIKEYDDDDCQYLIQQLHNRIRSFMSNIAEVYYKYNEDKDAYITYDSDDVSVDNYHLADSDSFKLSRYVENTMTFLTSHGIDMRICKMATNDLIKLDELKSIIEHILAGRENMPLVKEYITLMIVCYFQQSKTKDVRDLDFISFSIKAKPNTKDKYILRQKELIDLLLTNNSEYFNRRRSRPATESAYYRAMNAYFSLTIQQANK